MTLIELLIGLVVGLVITLAAFTLLEFTTNDVSRITARTHATQNARVEIENLMLQLHSSCVAYQINPVLVNSNANELKFVSETSPLNASNEPASAITKARLHKIIFTPASGKTEGVLTEQSWPSTGEAVAGVFPFAEGSPPTERRLLKGVSRTVEKALEVPVFQYYRYYRESDAGAKLGQFNPTPISPSTVIEAGRVAKVAVSFTVTPEGYESRFAKGDRAFAITDAAVLRLQPSSEVPTAPNEPCAQ